jgi:transcription initiation factor TFIID subunit TAF12
MIVGSLNSKEQNDHILDKQRLQELCADTCGRADVLEDKVVNYLAEMVDQMVENIVDYSCMYA